MNLLLDDRYPSPALRGPKFAAQPIGSKKANSPLDGGAIDGFDRPSSNPLITRLKQLTYLSNDDQIALLGAFDAPRKVLPKSGLDRSQDHSSSVRFIQQGFAYRYIALPDGRQQITNLLLPGDACDPLALAAPNAEHGICALTTVIYSEIKRPALVSLVEGSPRIAAAMWRSFQLTEAMLYERIASLGRRSAKERLAHFLCEVFFRCRAVGLTSGMQCSLPLSQGDLGDTLGLSLVHTNRSLMALRADKLIKLEARLLTIIDLARLQETAHFDPRYLQIEPEAAGTARSSPSQAASSHRSNVTAFDRPHRSAHI